MTAPRDFEPVRGFVAISEGAAWVFDRGQQTEHVSVYATRDSRNPREEVPCLIIPLSPSPDALERMADALYLRDARTHIEVKPENEAAFLADPVNDIYDECMDRACAAFAALAEGANGT